MNNSLQIIRAIGILSIALLTQRALGQKTNQWKDVIINEILPDPIPRIALPEAEFIELFNRSDHDIRLKSWSLKDAGSAYIFPDTVLRTGTYLIVSSNPLLFEGYGRTVGSKSVPSLNNDSDVLTLIDSAGVFIDSLHYYNSWFPSSFKDGGWSLELIDPGNICSSDGNWDVSEDVRGGTPGAVNSVFAEKPDLIGPSLSSVFPSDSNSVELIFSEPLARNVPDPSSFKFEPPLKVGAVSFTTAALNAVEILLDEAMLPKTTYQIMVSDIYDCAGNAIGDENRLNFGLPEAAIPGDVVINEILYNPKPGGGDFVELFNASDKFINMKDWSLCNLDGAAVADRHKIKDGNMMLNPHDYFVLTEDAEVLMSGYQNANEEKVFQCSLPKMNDDAGNIAVLDSRDSVLDYFAYTDQMQSIFLKNSEGVSLERISPTVSSSEGSNWSSASSNSGFATPGYLNSNAVGTSLLLDRPISVDPISFIPLSGQPGFTRISYAFTQGGYVANISIFDERGRLIKHIARNELLGTDGSFRWDGDRDDGYRARTGHYLIHVEVFDTSGATMTFNEGVSIASHF